MDRYVLGLEDIDRSHAALAGGKGAHLGELARMEGIRVPGGFCVTTDAFRRIVAETASLNERLIALTSLKPEHGDAMGALAAELRGILEGIDVPEDVTAEITAAIATIGDHAALAVRSSATAEDSPTASFAGQHESYLNVTGAAAVLDRVRRCWASLFTDRAVLYRVRNGVDHRVVRMGVVVQRMVAPRVSGTLFTADPVTGHRKVTTIEAGFGLGVGVVSGTVNADVWKVRSGEVVAKTIAVKRVALHASPHGGTEQRPVAPERQTQPTLTDAEVVRLARLGRRIEAHFGRPQDIEWCLVEDEVWVVQSRPITTLFPVPAADDDDNHVYVSVGHQQMMTDAVKPLGISVRQKTAAIVFHEAGGRLFVDVTPHLASPAGRARLLGLSRSDPLIGDALRTIVERGDFIRPVPGDGSTPTPAGDAPEPLETDPAIVEELMAQSDASIAALKRDIRGRSGEALLDFIVADFDELKRILFDRRSHRVFTSAMDAHGWLDENLNAWLGETHAADVLTRSVPRNVTSEMGLALLDVADAIRPHPEVVAYLERVEGGDFLDELPALEGGLHARSAIAAWLETYGMRCVGEIDITRPRWSERPGDLVPLILAHVRNFEPGEAARRSEEGRRQARAKEREVLARLRALPDGERRAAETKAMIDRVRTFIGYREYPKYGMMRRYAIYRQALLAEAERLVRAGSFRAAEDVYWLTLEELRDVVRTLRVDESLIAGRRAAFRVYEALTPPRVLTSEGEAVTGSYGRADVPAGALVGLPVSAGTVEGRARVVLDVADADLEPGDVLVTTCTDPSWTPLFVTAAGLVTEVGGLMTHGSVIAREYGLPAVVGVEDATRRIRDGQLVRVNGAEGWVEVVG